MVIGQANSRQFISKAPLHCNCWSWSKAGFAEWNQFKYIPCLGIWLFAIIHKYRPKTYICVVKLKIVKTKLEGMANICCSSDDPGRLTNYIISVTVIWIIQVKRHGLLQSILWTNHHITEGFFLILYIILLKVPDSNNMWRGLSLSRLSGGDALLDW